MEIAMNIAFSWDRASGCDRNNWNSCSCIAYEFERLGHTFDYYPFDPDNTNFDKLITNAHKYDFLYMGVAGPHQSFDNELQKLRSKTSTKVMMEFGDDIPTSNFFIFRKTLTDHIITPDLRCCKKYLDEGFSAHWHPNFCDPNIYYKINQDRKNICVTTCGHNRPLLKEFSEMFGEKFIAKHVSPQDSANFYNSGTFTYQYARWNELTRRIFEAGGCGNAVITNRLSEDSGIYDLFPEDECVAYFSTPKEAYEKMIKLYEDDDYRNYLANNLYKTVIEKHLVQHRVQKILEAYNEKLHNPTDI